METHRNDWKLWSPGPKEKKNQLGGQSGGGGGAGGQRRLRLRTTVRWRRPPRHWALAGPPRGTQGPKGLSLCLPSFLSFFLSFSLSSSLSSFHLVSPCVRLYLGLPYALFFLFCFPASLKGRLELFLCTLFDPCLPSFTGFFFWGGSLIAYFRPQLMQSSTWVVALLPSVLYSLFNTPSVKKGEGLGT